MTTKTRPVTHLPKFSNIHFNEIETRLTTLLDENQQKIEKLLEENQGKYTWTNLVAELENIDETLQLFWSPISHLNSVMNNDALRSTYQACLPKLSAYSTALGHNKALYHAYQALAESPEYANYDDGQQQVIKQALRDFHLSGIALNDDDKKRFKALDQRLAELGNQFSNNVLDATQAWTYHTTNSHDLDGVPEHAMQSAAENAKAKGLEGWLFTLEFPDYYPVMTHANSRELREKFYTAYVTRASEQGPNAKQWDNSSVIDEMLQLRHEMARLLEFNNFAELSLAPKMADSTDEVIHFLEELLEHSQHVARKELEELQTFAKQAYGLEQLAAWDLAFFSEKMRLHRYDISQEQLRPYFPEDKVLQGLFNIVNRLYGLQITEIKQFDSWHDDVRLFSIHDMEDQLRGYFYIDLYARSNKRGGAWMDHYTNRRLLNHEEHQTPVAFLTCNFSGPTEGKPALFTHDDVTTLFHEFGHGLHHMLTQVNYADVSGINGVAWDAVELPSQFMENWCWEAEAVAEFSAHYETGEPLPREMLEKMQAAKNFHSGIQMIRQLEFSIFDFLLHKDFNPDTPEKVQDVLNNVRNKVSVMQPPAFNRFQNSFGHIFGGGYAAGYYSYKWAEVLSSDAFSLFEEKGIFDADTGQAFLRCILEKGGSAEPMDLFIAFRGRRPSIEALLRHSGLSQ